MMELIFKARGSLYPKLDIRNIYNSLVFIFRSFVCVNTINQFVKSIKNSGFEHVLHLSPSVLGFVVWPYMHSEWKVSQRFNAISEHYQILSNLPEFLDVSDGHSKQLIDLGAYSEKLTLIIDKPKWFVREGEATINLFKGDLRVMSLAFSLGLSEKGLTIFIGCIQGIHAGIPSAESLEIIKNITKDLEGLRPRNFLIKVIQLISLSIHAKEILAISENNRQHCHRFFDNHLSKYTTSNYDEIWLEVGGLRLDNGFFSIPTQPKRRNTEEIHSNKRAQYRRRYAMMDEVKQHISNLI